MQDDIILDACIDQPDERDYQFAEVFGVSEQLPRSVRHFRTTVQNQTLKTETKYACTLYSGAHCCNESNAIEAEKNGVPSFLQIDAAGEVPSAILEGFEVAKGWSLQASAKHYRDRDYITGTTVCRNVLEAKDAINKGQLIQSGSKSIDWKKTRENGFVVVRGTSYGHAFAFDWYDDNLHGGVLIWRNSNGDKYGVEGGRFYVKYEDFALLFTCYAYVDKDNADIIRAYQSKKRREEAKRLWLWNGERENDNASRFEVATIAGRLRNLKAATLSGEIWGGLRPDDTCTRFEAFTMLERAVGRKFSFILQRPDDKITRGEVAELAVRL